MNVLLHDVPLVFAFGTHDDVDLVDPDLARGTAERGPRNSHFQFTDPTEK
jgi:hypothetical protein